MSERYQYNSVDVGMRSNSECYEDPDYGTCKRLPWIVLLPSVIFALLVGHISTIAYLGTTKTPMNNSLGSNNEDGIAVTQKYAESKFHEKLVDPCLASEEFYNNSTDKEKVSMSAETSRDEDPKPPPRPPTDGCTGTILVLRHCEAGDAREHCGYMGRLRSQYIASLFGDNARWPGPDYIFAMAPGERHNDLVKNWREIETVQPLGDKVKVDIDQTYGYPEKQKFVKHLYKMLRNGEMCDKVAVVSWKHHDIPHFAHSLGCGPQNGCPVSFGEFDYESIWQLTYSYHKQIYAPYVVEDTTPHGKKKHQNHPWGIYPQWFVYGTMQAEGFDPLAFTKTTGFP